MVRVSGRALLGRWLALMGLGVVALQAYFALHILALNWLDPHSTAFQRSEFWRVVVLEHRLDWEQAWRPYARLGLPIKRAVIASEDASFTDHDGFDWDALEKAWQRNERARERAERQNQVAESRAAAKGTPAAPRVVQPKVVGGSTISQQLAKNLFLSGERTAVRKGEEFVITFLLEGLLDKSRILEIYLNSVEWGDGVFGAQAAARHYFHVDADQLSVGQAARLAVMLPAPKRFERQPGSAYVSARSATIAARMGAAEVP